MKAFGLVACAAVLALLLAACFSGPTSGKGLHLPEGNISQGQAAFAALKCHECHRVDGVSLPAPVSDVATNIILGGKVSHIQTHGELVTAIINPAHSLAAGFDKARAQDGQTSPMPTLNDRMTVNQLIDIVAFLQSRYELIDPKYKVSSR